MGVCIMHCGTVMKMDGGKLDDMSYREGLIDEFIRHCSDIIPYSDPNYEEKLLKMAERYADDVMDPDSEYNRKLRELNLSMDNEPLEGIPF